MAERQAKSTGRDRRSPPRRVGVRRRDAIPVGDGAPGYTTEELRGRSFFEKLRMWQVFHRDGGQTVYTKATLERHQVRLEYATPGKTPTERTLAALGTRFDREEDAVYLIGAEPAPDGSWRRPVPWKLDRVGSLVPLASRRNPDPSAYPGHRLLAEVTGEEAAVSRLGDAFTVVAPQSLVTRLLETIRGIEQRHARPCLETSGGFGRPSKPSPGGGRTAPGDHLPAGRGSGAT